VTMLAGNHDCWGGDVLRDAGVDFQFGPWTGRSAAGVRAWSTATAARRGGSRLSRAASVLRNRLAIRAFGALHPDLASRSRWAARTPAATYQPKDFGTWAARGGRGHAGGRLPRSSCSCMVIRTSRRWSACRRVSVRERGELARRSDFSGGDTGAGSRSEAGSAHPKVLTSHEPRSPNRGSDALASETAADRPRR
jgi:hypothetical protein